MKIFNGESGYIDCLKMILSDGVDVPDRTGVGCRGVFNANFSFSPEDFCLSTVRSMPLRMSYEEFWMMLRGETQTKPLEDKGIFFWKPQTSREFLDNRGLTHLDEGDMGKAYGFQWRKFGEQGDISGFDQLKYVCDTLKNDRYSRRILVNLWNPLQNDEKALTECWFGCQFVVLPSKSGKDVLHLKLFNRSLDALFGFYFAVAQYRLLQLSLCKMFGFELGNLDATVTHCHLYQNQIEYTKELIQRDFGKQGEVIVKKEIKTLDDLLSLQWGDFDVVGLEVNKTPFVTPRPEMAC